MFLSFTYLVLLCLIPQNESSMDWNFDVKIEIVWTKKNNTIVGMIECE